MGLDSAGTNGHRSLLNPRYDFDSCGVGFVATLHARPSHETLRLALIALGRLAHRGAIAADGKSSDGVGVLTAVPRRFLLRETSLTPANEQPLAVGMLFLPRNEDVRREEQEQFSASLGEQGLQILGWRDVPVNRDVLGEIALACLPAIQQALVTERTEGHR